MKRELPKFKYHPDPIATEMIQESKVRCPVCSQETGYEYVGPFYARSEVEGICPWCIKNGKAAEKYDLEFVDPYHIDQVNNEEAIEELIRRTPGVYFPQEDTWPAHCGDYCIILGGERLLELRPRLALLKMI